MGGPLTDRDPRAAFEVSWMGLDLGRRFGHRQGVSILVIESRQLFERMGAGLWLGLLDDAEAGRASPSAARPVTPRPTAHPHPRVPADQA
jgi:hypothetical protein